MKYDLAVTSCRRNDLLKITLESFKKYADVAPENVYVIEDSENLSVADVVRSIYPDATVINNIPQLGQMRSIQKLYGYCKSEFVFHCEDDWEFFRAGFIKESLQLLRLHRQASLVSLRPRSELNPLEKKQPKLSTDDGLEYFLTDPNAHPEWFSYSFNPGLRRLNDLDMIGEIDQYPSESEVSLAFKQKGFYFAFLEEPAVRHIGGGRHVNDPTRPPKAKTFRQRMTRSIRKRLDRFRRRLVAKKD